MTKEIERILQNTPYNSYEDLFGAIYSGKARIGISLSACRQIATINRPFFANYGMHFGFVPSALLTIALSLSIENHMLLLLLPLEFMFSFAVYLLRIFKVKPWPIAAIILLVDLFIIKTPLYVFILTTSWLLCCLACRIWQKKSYSLSIKVMQCNTDAFEWAFNSHNLTIEDCYGNTYNKAKQDEIERTAHAKLLRILQIGADVKDIDSAIKTFFLFYRRKGVLLDDELIDGMAFCSLQQKQESLLTILETGMGIHGINNVIAKLLDFYRAKGKSFPIDL